MASQTLSSPDRQSQDRKIWDNLKKAIVVSSGFKRWQEEQEIDDIKQVNIDENVRRYLRETLATLAY
jgi:hypothetical protein